MTNNYLAACIRSYWRARGYDVIVFATECNEGKFRYPAVRSNLVGGLPREYRGDRAPLADAQTMLRAANG